MKKKYGGLMPKKPPLISKVFLIYLTTMVSPDESSHPYTDCVWILDVSVHQVVQESYVVLFLVLKLTVVCNVEQFHHMVHVK